MDQRTLNTITRFDKVKAFLDGHPAIVASVGALAAAAATYAGLLALLPKTAATPMSATEGATEDKFKARMNVAELLVPLLSALKLHYKQAGNLERARAMDLTRPSSLKTMATLRFNALAATALQYIDELPAGTLDSYNQKAADLDAFRAAATRFGIKKSSPTEARDTGKVAGDTIDEQVDDVRDYVEDDLRSAVNLVARTNPEFVRGFKQANKTDDLPGKQNKTLREKNKKKRDEAAGNDPNTPPIPPNSSGVGS